MRCAVGIEVHIAQLLAQRLRPRHGARVEACRQCNMLLQAQHRRLRAVAKCHVRLCVKTQPLKHRAFGCPLQIVALFEFQAGDVFNLKGGF